MFYIQTLIHLQNPDMKNLIIIPAIAFMLVSGNIFGQTKRANRESKECTVVNATNIPDAVMQSFTKSNTTQINGTWFQLNKHKYAVLQSKVLTLFKSNGKTLPKVKIDTIPYGAFMVFNYKYPGIKYQRCYKINKHSFVVMFNKGGNSELAYYPNRISLIDEERDFTGESGVDMDNMDLWWDNDRVDEN
jgi:hypothetical protein